LRSRRIGNWFLVRPGEGSLVAYLSMLCLLLGFGLALGRSSSDALFFKRFGVEYLPHMFFVTSILLVMFSAVYATFADRAPSALLFRWILLLLSGFLIANWAYMQLSDDKSAFAMYFLGYAVVSEILLVHFNLYASGFLDTLQSKRLFPVISAGSRLGAVLGGALLGITSAWWPTENIALAWLALLIATTGLIALRHKGDPTSSRARFPGNRKNTSLSQILEGLGFARRSALLRITGAAVFVMIMLVSIQDYLASTILTAHFADDRALAGFFGWFFAFTNGAVLVLQLATTNRLLRRFGLKTVNLIFPLSTTISFGLLSVSASFVPAVIARFNYLGIMPAFRNPAANLFYNALPAYMQGRARALNIGLILPLGLAAAGLMLMAVPKEQVGEPLAMAGVALCLIYLYLKARKNAAYGDSLVELIRQQVYSGDELVDAGPLDARTVDRISGHMRQCRDEDDFLQYASILVLGAPQEAGKVLLEVAPSQSSRVQDSLLQHIAKLRPAGWQQFAQQCLDSPDHHLRTTALKFLTTSGDLAVWQTIRQWLNEGTPRLRAAAISVAVAGTDSHLAGMARTQLDRLLSSNNANEVIAGLSAARSMDDPDLLAQVHAATCFPDARTRAAAIACLTALSQHLMADCHETLSRALDDSSPLVRRAAVCSVHTLTSAAQRLQLLAHALHDTDHGVRKAAMDNAAACMPSTAEEYRSGIRRHMDEIDLQSLLCMHVSRSPLVEKQALLNELGDQHLRKALCKKGLALQLAQLPPGEGPSRATREFLLLVLEEEVQRHIELVLECIGALEPDAPLHTIRAALASRDAHLRARALESLQLLNHTPLLGKLLPLLEARHERIDWPDIPTHDLHDLNEMLEWCSREGTVWLKQASSLLRESEIMKGAPELAPGY
jgi:hypothetical protein